MPLHFFWETWSCPKQNQFKGNSVASCLTRISADWQKPFLAMDRGHNSNQITNSKNFASSCFCGKPLPNYSGFARLHHLFQKMRGLLGWYQSISFIFHSGSKEGVPEGPTASSSSHPKGRPPHLLPGMILHWVLTVISHLSLAGRLKHCMSNKVAITKDPWVLEAVQGDHLDFLRAHTNSLFP